MTSNNSTRKSMNGLINTPTTSDNIEITQNLNMNSFKIINLGDGTDDKDAVNLGQIAGIAVNTAKIVILDNSVNKLDISINKLDN